jgi:hypothetical protein
MLSRSSRALALVAAAVFVSACGPTGGAAPSAAPTDTPSAAPVSSPTLVPNPTPAPSLTPAAVLILRVTGEGGFIGPAAGLAALPTVSVYADGRIITPGATDAIYPAPLLTVAQVRDVGAAGIAAIEAAIRAAGLDKPSAAGPGVAGDTGTTVFAVTLDGTTVTTRLAALGGGPPGPGGPGGAGGDPARAAALDLLNRLTDPTETWGAPATAPTVLHPAGYRVFVAPGAPPTDPSVTAAPLDWPLAVPLAELGAPAVPDRGIAGLRMGVVTGADADTLGPVLAKASQLTPFMSAGQPYTLYVRPLLPDELGG